MCLVFVWRAPAADEACDDWEHELAERYRLVLASNRDEIIEARDRSGLDYSRRWSAAAMCGGGPWLGMTDGGRWSCILNVREPGRPENDLRAA